MAAPSSAQQDSRVYTPDDLGSFPDAPRRYAVLGYPVAHSLSPAFQRAGLAALGLDACYEKIEIPPERFAETVSRLRQMRLDGWNCTLPHKIALAALVDDLADSARTLGGVNTVLREGDKLVGFNTDGEGWVAAIREEFQVDVGDLRVMILGAGGAGQALAIQAAIEGCERLVLVNRTEEKVRQLRRQLEPLMRTEKLLGAHERLLSIPWDETQIERELEATDLLVNATSVGLKSSDPRLLPPRLLAPSLMVYDTIYRPAKTRLLLDAAQNGARVANGLSMLLHQGAASLEIWTGKAPPLPAMRRALNEAAQAAG